jgi:hypothetical protein
MKIFIRSIQTLLLLSFFLPFIKTCNVKEVNRKEADNADTLSINRSSINDSHIDTSSLATEIDSSYITASTVGIKESDSFHSIEPSITFETILNKIWQTMIWPEYGNGITGFGFSMFIIASLIEGGIIEPKGIILYLTPLSLLCALALLIIPIRKKKTLLNISLLGTSSLFALTAFIIFNNSVEDILLGIWAALGLFLLHTIYLTRNWKLLESI